jgi:hypothetical protein
MSDAPRPTGLDVMSHTDIRAMLRGATRAKVLFGWCPYEWGDETFWVIRPPHAKTSNYTTAEAVDYCRMLSASGVQPVYRTV